MFDQFQDRHNGRDEPRWIGPRILTVAAAGLLLAGGLCGYGAIRQNGTEEFGGSVSVFGFAAFLLSVIVLLFGAVVFVVELIQSSRKSGE